MCFYISEHKFIEYIPDMHIVANEIRALVSGSMYSRGGGK